MIINEEKVFFLLKQRGASNQVLAGGSKYLLDGFKSFVEEVENGYQATEDEYFNDVDGRDLIHTAQLDDHPLVIELDKRLKAMLVNTHERVWRHDRKGETYDWWNFGYPKNFPHHLQEYFGK